jgi:hypothetical protein
VTNAHLINNLIHNKKNANVQKLFHFKLLKLVSHVIFHIILIIQQNNVNLAQKIMFIILIKINAGDVLKTTRY